MTNEENALLESMEKEEWKSAKNKAGLIKELKETATNRVLTNPYEIRSLGWSSEYSGPTKLQFRDV